MIMKKRPFFEEFKQPLDKVHRTWLRRWGLISLTPILLVGGIVVGVAEVFGEMYEDCW